VERINAIKKAQVEMMGRVHNEQLRKHLQKEHPEYRTIHDTTTQNKAHNDPRPVSTAEIEFQSGREVPAEQTKELPPLSKKATKLREAPPPPPPIATAVDGVSDDAVLTAPVPSISQPDPTPWLPTEGVLRQEL
jgi:hypothetical protein